MSTYTVHPLQTGKAERPTAYYTYLRNGDETSSVFYGPFLLKSADRNVLVDTGCDAVNYAEGPPRRRCGILGAEPRSVRAYYPRNRRSDPYPSAF